MEFTDESRGGAKGGLIPAENLVQNGTAGETLNQMDSVLGFLVDEPPSAFRPVKNAGF